MKRILLLALTLVLAFPAVSTATVASHTGRISHDCNGILTDYSYTFNTYETSEVSVIVDDTEGTEDTLTVTDDYTVACTNDDCSSGGTVTLDSASLCPSGSVITIVRNTTIDQGSDFTEGMAALYETFELELDKRTRIEQQLQEQADRALRLTTPAYGTSPPTLTITEPAADRANKYLKFDPSGDLTLAEILNIGTYYEFLDEDDMASNSATGIPSQQSVVSYITNYVASQILDEDNFASDSATKAPSQQSTGAYVRDGTYTMTNKTLTAPILTSPVLNGTMSGTGVIDDDTMATATDGTLATSESVKAYVDNLTWMPGVVQVARLFDGTNTVTTTNIIAATDDIPQNTDGAEAMTLSITPTSATNYLFVVANGVFATYAIAAPAVAMALFKDSEANARAVVHSQGVTSARVSNTLFYSMQAGTTDPITFKIRFGAGSADGNTHFNKIAASRLYGTTAASTITIFEIGS